jgi:hypothetical protein
VDPNTTSDATQRGERAPAIATRSYSLAEVAALYLPPEWKDGIRWLSRRLNAGEIRGYKVGRVWRMTDDDVAAFIEGHRNSPKPTADAADDHPPMPATSIIDGLSPRSRARITRRTAQPSAHDTIQARRRPAGVGDDSQGPKLHR